MPRQPPSAKPIEEETLFETICRLAREMNINGLREIHAHNPTFLFEIQDGLSPVKLLAMEGNGPAVRLLLKQFNAYVQVYDAIGGYAEVGLTAMVNEMLIEKKPGEFASSQDYRAYIDQHIFVFNGWPHAIQGYVRGGLDECVEDVLRAYPNMIDVAVMYYAKAAKWEKVEEIVARGGRLDPQHVSEQSLQDDPNLCFRLMSAVNNEDARRNILTKANPWIADDEFKFIQLIKKAGRMNRLMREYDLDFQLALPLHEFQEKGQLTGVREWLLYGLQVAKDRPSNMPVKNDEKPFTVLPLLSKDAYLNITRLLLNLSIEDTRKVLVGVYSQLFASVEKSNARKFAHGLFSTTEFITAQIKEIDEHEPRVKRLKN